MAFIGSMLTTGSFTGTHKQVATLKSSGGGGGVDSGTASSANSQNTSGSFELVIQTGDVGNGVSHAGSSGSIRIDVKDGGAIRQALRVGANNSGGFVQTGNTSNSGYDFRIVDINNVEYMRVDPASTTTVFNEGSADLNFRVESNNNTHMFFVDGGENRVQIGNFNGAQPANLLTIFHGDADGNDGIQIVRNDTTVVENDWLGGIGFDSRDGNTPSSVKEASAFIGAYAAQNQSSIDKGGYMVIGTSAIDESDDTVSTERLRIGPDSLVQVSGSLRVRDDLVVGSNIIRASDGGATITMDTSDNVSVRGKLKVAGDTAASDAAAIGYTATEGIIITGQGSTNDVTIKNDADTAVIRIPTGGTDVRFEGDIIVDGGDAYVQKTDGNATVFVTRLETGDSDIQAGDEIGFYGFQQSEDGSNIHNSGGISMIAAENFGFGSKQGSHMVFYTTANGNNSNSEGMRLTQDKSLTIQNDLTVTGNTINGSAGANITLGSSGDVTIAGDLTLTGEDLIGDDLHMLSTGNATIRCDSDNNATSNAIFFERNAGTVMIQMPDLGQSTAVGCIGASGNATYGSNMVFADYGNGNGATQIARRNSANANFKWETKVQDGNEDGSINIGLGSNQGYGDSNVALITRGQSVFINSIWSYPPSINQNGDGETTYWHENSSGALATTPTVATSYPKVTRLDYSEYISMKYKIPGGLPVRVKFAVADVGNNEGTETLAVQYSTTAAFNSNTGWTNITSTSISSISSTANGTTITATLSSPPTDDYRIRVKWNGENSLDDVEVGPISVQEYLHSAVTPQTTMRVLNDYSKGDTAHEDHFFIVFNDLGVSNSVGYIYAASTNPALLVYGQFTGAHQMKVPSETEWSPYQLMKIIGIENPAADEPLYICVPTSSAEDKATLGIANGACLNAADSNDVDVDSLSDDEKKWGIISLGNFKLLVCSEGGNIEVGDFICSSNTVGHGMKQNSENLTSYTAAKASEAVDWSQEFETELVRNEEGKIVRQTKLDENGNPVLKPTKLINVTVHCG